MKIGVIRRRFAASGGAELYVQRLLAGLVERNHEPHLFSEHWEQLPEGVVYHPVKAGVNRGTRSLHFAHAVQAALGKEHLNCVLSLERTLRQDVYRAGDGVHKVWLERWRQFAPWWKRPFIGHGAFHQNMLRLEAQTFDPQNTEHIIVNSEMVRQEILGCFGFPEARIHLIRNGVNTDRIRRGDRTQARKRFGIGADEFVIAFVGSGWDRKGLRFLIQAVHRIASHTTVRLLVAGKGRVPADAPKDAVFTGPLNDVQDVYAAADLFVTLPIYEPSANVVAEALAAGLPVITSKYNGAGEWLTENVTGSVVANPADVAAVAERIRFWVESRGVARDVLPSNVLDMQRNVTETLALLEKVAR